jgi:hypothetical protein
MITKRLKKHRAHVVFAGGIVILLLFLLRSDIAYLSVLPGASDGDAIPELRLEGAAAVKAGTQLAETVHIDDDIPSTLPVGSDLVGGLSFTLIIPEICKNGTVSISMNLEWNATAAANIEAGGEGHMIGIVAAATENLDTSDGQEVVTVRCETEITDPTEANLAFSDIDVSKFNSNLQGNPISVDVLGESKEVAVVMTGDANLDVNVNVLDMIAVAKHILGIAPLTDAELVAADISPVGTLDAPCGDGDANTSDLIAIGLAIVNDDTETFLLNSCTP